MTKHRTTHLKLIRNASGAAMVEMALIAVPLFLVMIATVQNILVSIARTSLDANVQSLVYDAANHGAVGAMQMLNRQALCNRAGFYLVSCANSSELCFSVVPLDAIATNDLTSLPCQNSSIFIASPTSPLAIIVEYRIANYFARSGPLLTSDMALATFTTIRSVALFDQGG